MKRRISVLLTLIFVASSLTVSFAEDEHPSPKNAIPPMCEEHISFNCDTCIY